MIEIGRLGKSFGVKGALRLKLDEIKYIEDLIGCDVLFVEIEGQKLPYFIEEIQEGRDLLIFFDDVKDKQAAEKLVNRPIWLRAEDVLPEVDRTLPEDALEFSFAEGFEIWDEEMGLIGKIEGVEAYPEQELALVNYLEKEVLIPLNNQLVLEVDQENKRIIMNLPDGLLDL